MVERKGREHSRRQKEIPLEERNRTFFNQDVRTLAETLQGRIIILAGSDKRIRVDSARPYAKSEIGKNYRRGREGVNIDNIPVRSLWAFHLPVRRMRQALILAKDQGQGGTCVRIERASRYDQASQSFVPMNREGDIANYFELDNYEVAALGFRDQSDELYLERKQRTPVVQAESTLDSSSANQYLEDLLKE